MKAKLSGAERVRPKPASPPTLACGAEEQRANSSICPGAGACHGCGKPKGCAPPWEKGKCCCGMALKRLGKWCAAPLLSAWVVGLGLAGWWLAVEG